MITTSDKLVGEEEDVLREVFIITSVHYHSLMCNSSATVSGANESLDRWLFFGGEERRRLLSCLARCRADVARVLAYLHHECREQILDLDVKPTNILLDGGLRSHMSVFGTSMAIAKEQNSVITRGRGTRGYMAPELWVGSMSTKSDVYSYSVTLLELIAERRSFEPTGTNGTLSSSSKTPHSFRRFMLKKVTQGELMEVVVDAATPDLGAVVKVGLCCVRHMRDERPSMLTVVEMLEG
ncbi:hypothetical protein SETIT_7G059500v2 [Setaria italica]|uniref:Protein kinase domain-containing protein n=1 Tax=Setaria italica TaxID=4555 RepID=K3YE52_SETIT|nr:hypothetical protein SETIT_7G059500v2 [Setaria italica]